MEERRRFPRSRAYIGAQIAYKNRCCTMDCLVRNVSQDGARLIFAGTATIPIKFDMVIRRAAIGQRGSFGGRKPQSAFNT
jgi:hypothetical protein